MLPRPRRPPGRLILLYLAVSALALGLLSARHSRPQSGGVEAVPALAGSREPENDGRPARSGLTRAVLRLGLPVLDVYNGSSMFTPGQIFNSVSRHIAGFSPGDPLSLLRLQMPALALDGPEDGMTGETDAGDWTPLPLPYIPLDPAAVEAGPSRPLPPPDRPLVIVYQTHAHESFEPALKAAGLPADTPYTADERVSIVRVGEEVARALQEEHGIPTLHLRTPFDAGGLTGSYMESEKGVKAAMSRYPTARVLLDIHRDSTGREATVTVVGGKPVARVMFVVGQGNRHLPNPHWRKNQALGRAIARALDTAVQPDLLPPTYAGSPGQRFPSVVRQLSDSDGDPWTFGRDGRFNQHLAEKAILIEVGGPGNTMVEELRAARLVARAVAEALGRAGR